MAVKVKITCLVDNSAAINSNLWGEDGSSLLVETSGAKILFDCGLTSEVLAHNLAALKMDLMYVKHLVLSHAHPAHTGALNYVLEQMREPTLTGDPEMFAVRCLMGEKDFAPFGLPLKRSQVENRVRLNLTKEAYNIVAGVTVSGRIPRVTPTEVPEEKYMVEADGLLATDNFVDERCIILEGEKGLIVIAGCAHVGFINTLVYAIKLYGKPIHTIIGGMHMNDMPMEKVIKTLNPIREKIKPQNIYLTHCAGLEPFQAFRTAMGSVVKNLPAGTVLTL